MLEKNVLSYFILYSSTLCYELVVGLKRHILTEEKKNYLVWLKVMCFVYIKDKKKDFFLILKNFQPFSTTNLHAPHILQTEHFWKSTLHSVRYFACCHLFCVVIVFFQRGSVYPCCKTQDAHRGAAG